MGVKPPQGGGETSAALARQLEPAAAERMVEFFAARILNANTRAAYAKTAARFLAWCGERGLELDRISPVAVGIYVDDLQGAYRAPTIKQHLAAVRGLFDWLVLGQVVSWNPAATVRVLSVNYFGVSCCLIGGCYPLSSE